VSIELLGVEHVVSLQITKEGKYKYFDSNFRKRIGMFDTAESLAEHMIKFWHMPQGKIRNVIINIDSFNAYKFYEKHEIVPEVETAAYKESAAFSPNNFTKLHQAIMQNDLDAVRYELTHNPLHLFFLDCNEASPLQMAIRLQNRACLQLIKEIGLFKDGIASDINFFELEQLEPDFISYLLSEGWFKLEDYDHEGHTLLHCSISYLNKEYAMTLLHNFEWDINKADIFGDTPLIWASTYNPDPEIIDAFFSRNDLDINKPNLFGITPLMSAITENNIFLVQRLLDAGASLEPLDHQNRSAFDYAIDSHMSTLLNEVACNRMIEVASKLMIFSHHHSEADQSVLIDTLNNTKMAVKSDCSVLF
ncbi:MAG TPA: ankyrin repeat domain-containing protein, partial [Candidatus Berkiella sp.]|nr:ankyrin repeat domain-containing protein [Candidatus Berkiella sp.]